MDLKRLEFTLTRKCNSQCIHCQADASPFRNEVMDTKDACNYLTEATTASNPESFMVFGGEPMLYPERATAIFRKAHLLGIPHISMITNGFWGRSKETAEKLATKLKEAGLDKVNMSIDSFHLPYTPLECPKNAAQALLKAGIENVKWNVSVIESIDAKNKYDEETRELLKKLEPVAISANVVRIMPMGRALKNLRGFFHQTQLDGPCEGEPIPGEYTSTLTNPETICIEPSGSVDICSHLSIGNAKQTPLGRIMNEYNWQRNPIIKTLVEKGPKGLLNLPETSGYKLQENYYLNKCHLCTEIRKTPTESNARTLQQPHDHKTNHTQNPLTRDLYEAEIPRFRRS